ncbi:hypothetical protein GCM10012280_58630 [Wenjunlia tyrosinilytica]|uniref:Uncharacterized protein n=1 Tax=Wenjunlia tyrosinilytica TaxID=1544741 RepID=A0A917ZWC9_9ACTN|nr:hypothetical protein GCM10012280_58630 [Wenjunlia tyrosinilytica]
MIPGRQWAGIPGTGAVRGVAGIPGPAFVAHDRANLPSAFAPPTIRDELGLPKDDPLRTEMHHRLDPAAGSASELSNKGYR